MWTRLVAGVAAHDINNLAQALHNLLSLGSAPGASPEMTSRCVSLAREGIQQLQDLGRDLRTLADNEDADSPQRLDLLCADALPAVQPSLGRSIVIAPPFQPCLVCGRAAPLRMAILAIVRYALGCSAPGAQVRIQIAADAPHLMVDAPTAPALRSEREGSLEDLMGGPDLALASDAGLVLAGAALSMSGGEIRAAPGPEGGIRFKLCVRGAGALPAPT